MIKTTKALAVFAFALTVLCFAGCAKKESPVPVSQEKQEEQKDAREIVEEPTKAKMQYVRPELIDWQGAKVGREIPEWIDSVVDGDTQVIASQLKLSDRKLWVISNSGPDLDFLKIWTDKVDIQSEVAQSISSEIGRQTLADIEASANLDSVTKTKAINDTTTVLTNVRVNNLEKSNQYWILTRTPKVANPSKDSDYKYEYTYFVVYSMEMESFKMQMEEALKSVATNTSQDSVLQQIITARIANSLLPANQAQIITATDSASNVSNAVGDVVNGAVGAAVEAALPF